MRAVTFQAPGEVRVSDVPEPQLIDPGDAIVRIEATGVCGSDLHIYHGRVKIEPGFTIGHEYVGTVHRDRRGRRASVQVGDRVLGCFQTACGRCYFCRRGWFHKCDSSRTFGHGAALGSLQGTQAEQALVPNADLVLRKIPAGMSDEAALFAGDVMGTGYHAVADSGLRAGDVAAVLGLGPVGLCAVQAAKAAGAAHVIAIDSVPERLAMAESFGAQAVHLTEGDPRAAAREATEGEGSTSASTPSVTPRRLTSRCGSRASAAPCRRSASTPSAARCTWGCCGSSRCTSAPGHANVIGHVDRVLAMMSAGLLDPTPLVTHHMSLERCAGGVRSV